VEQLDGCDHPGAMPRLHDFRARAANSSSSKDVSVCVTDARVDRGQVARVSDPSATVIVVEHRDRLAWFGAEHLLMAAGGARKRGLNRALADAGLGELFRQLDYKAGWYGGRVVKADRWFPSSKLCSGCGVVKAKLHLSERTYECDSCGLVIDWDLNAAVNLARYAQRATDPSTGVVTGGADRKTSPNGDAGGSETRTRAGVGGDADDGGSASSKEKAA
jgi:Putative transposase DNA-binding domain